MRFLAMGIVFTAIGFVAANAVISLLIVLLWRVSKSAPRRSNWLFAIRVSPAVGSIGFALGLVLPAFWLFEPTATTESPSLALLGFVFAAAALVAAGLHRTIVSWLDTRRIERLWRAAAVGRADVSLPVRAYRVPSESPVAALVGVFRPRLFVSDRFLAALSADERSAVLDHEAGHMLSLDNLKRTVMRLAPDCLTLSTVGREIEAAWAIATEEEADDHAVGTNRARSLDLAGALLKAARLTPVRCAPASNFYDGATVARRVARLLEDRPRVLRPAGRLAPRLAGLMALVLAAVSLTGPALRAVYAMTEAAIQLLQ
jgi:hypothetical protein